MTSKTKKRHYPVGWGCWIYWLHLCRGVKLPQVAQLAVPVEYTNCISAKGLKLFQVAQSAGTRIHRLFLYRGVRPHPNECPIYDTKQFDSVVPVMLELWGMRSTPSLPLLPGPLWLGVVAPDRVLSMGQIELNSVLMLNWMVRNKTVFDIESVYLC